MARSLKTCYPLFNSSTCVTPPSIPMHVLAVASVFKLRAIFHFLSLVYLNELTQPCVCTMPLMKTAV